VSLTLATVGLRAGYSRGLATARFGSKAKLIDAVIDRIVKRQNINRVLCGANDKCGLASLVLALEAVRHSYARDPRSLRILHSLMFEALGPSQELRARLSAFHLSLRGDIVAVIRRGVADGSIAPDVKPELEAELIIAMLRGVAYQWRLDPEGFDPEACLDHMINAARTHLGA
jgi:AcrR family transcriptional regulator